MAVKTIEYNGILYAQVIWANSKVAETTFFSPPESSFQFGLLAHAAGFKEAPHRHKSFERVIKDMQQMFVVQSGRVDVILYSDEGEYLETIELNQGDAIVLIHGVHAIEVREDMQCLSVKQGPFLGTEYDKMFVEVRE